MIRAKFTLIELLVVIAIISILMSIMLPALKKAKDVGKSISCRSTLKQFGQVMHLYASENADFLPEFHASSCWDRRIAPYLNYKYLGKISGIRTGTSDIFHCPSAKKIQDSTYDITFSRSYAMNKYIAQNYDGIDLKLYSKHRFNNRQWVVIDGWASNLTESDLALYGTSSNLEYFSTGHLDKIARRHSGNTANFVRKDGSVDGTKFSNSYGDKLVWILYENGKYYQNGLILP